MSQEQAQVSIGKAEAARRSARRRRHRDGDEPDSAHWRDAVPWYRPQDTRPGDEDE